jgi:hypothetical protein
MDPSPALTLAARCDAEGRHSEAIDHLARAAGAGDAGALAALGKRLLTGENAPFRPKDAVGLLVDAANRGDGEAAHLVSVIAGGGIHAPQNWRAALDFLVLSARHGWPPAQEQLRLLAGLDPGDGAADWDTLHRAADLSPWLASPSLRNQRDRPRIQSVDHLIPPNVCAWIIRQSEPRLQRAEVHDPETGLPVMGATRTNRVANFGLLQTGLVNLLVQARIAAAVGVSIAMMEAFAVLNYRVGEEASEHHDFLDPAVPAYASEIARLGQRVATCLLYLNGDYEGGVTAFPMLGFSHKGRMGEALIFHSTGPKGVPDPSTLHAGRPPTAGEKWVLSQFIRDKPWLGGS